MNAAKSTVATMVLAGMVAAMTGLGDRAGAATNPAQGCLRGNPNAATTMKNSCSFPVSVYYQPTKGPGSARTEVKSVDLAPGQSKPYGLGAEQMAQNIVAAICPLHQKPYVGRAAWYANITPEEARAAGAGVSVSQTGPASPKLIELDYQCRG